MTGLNESLIEDAALTWFGELGWGRVLFIYARLAGWRDNCVDELRSSNQLFLS